MHIPIHLDVSIKATLQSQIADQIVSMILEGTLKAGAPLPSTRELSSQLRVSRNTVFEAYERLVQEGYIAAARARGTYVRRTSFEQSSRSGETALRDAATVPTNLPLPYSGRGLPGLYEPPDPAIRIDFRFGRSDPCSFPEKIWRRLLIESMGGAAERLSQYGDPAGLPELREAIAEHLGPARGIKTSADRIVVVGGFQQGLALAAHLFVGVHSPIAIEAPCYRGAAFLFESYGGRLIPVPIDDEGIDVAQLPSHRVKFVYVTPSHQFPAGTTMSLRRRIALLDWAARTGAYILEVDYDSDFKYDGPILPSLHSLDRNGCVIYLNSFSRSLGPGLRLGYMVVPQELVHAAATLKGLIDNGSPWLEQATLAQFIKTGSLATHLKRVRQTYMRRRDTVLVALDAHFGEVATSGGDGGTHLLWSLPEEAGPAAEAQCLARRMGVGLHPLDDSAVLYPDMMPSSGRKVLLGYTHLDEAEIARGIAKIAKAVENRLH